MLCRYWLCYWRTICIASCTIAANDALVTSPVWFELRTPVALCVLCFWVPKSLSCISVTVSVQMSSCRSNMRTSMSISVCVFVSLSASNQSISMHGATFLDVLRRGQPALRSKGLSNSSPSISERQLCDGYDADVMVDVEGRAPS